MRHGGDVLGLLHGAGGKHRETGLAAGHHVLVVAEDGQGVGRQGTCGHVEDGRKHFTCNLVHVRNHQKKTLGGGIGRRERTGLQGTVDGTRGAGLALHLGDLDGLAPEILLSVGRPFVHVFRHRGGRRDRIDGGMLAEQVSDVRSGLVTVTGDEFLFFSHNRF